MSRRHRAEKREIIPDPKFGDVVVTKNESAPASSEKDAGATPNRGSQHSRAAIMTGTGI